MIVLVPSDAAFRRLIPELKPNVPSPLLKDIPLMQHIMSGHVIVQEGTIPSSLLRDLPEYIEIVKVNLRGQSVVFHREEDRDRQS